MKITLLHSTEIQLNPRILQKVKPIPDNRISQPILWFPKKSKAEDHKQIWIVKQPNLLLLFIHVWRIWQKLIFIKYSGRFGCEFCVVFQPTQNKIQWRAFKQSRHEMFRILGGGFASGGERIQDEGMCTWKIVESFKSKCLQLLIRIAACSSSRPGTASSDIVTFEVAFETRRCLEPKRQQSWECLCHHSKLHLPLTELAGRGSSTASYCGEKFSIKIRGEIRTLTYISSSGFVGSCWLLR